MLTADAPSANSSVTNKGMFMEIYTVTFCAMDQEVGANPFWHTCLLLSCYDDKTKKLEVIENWGFGGVPATSPYPLIRKIKKSLRLDTDFYGNHGMLYGEEIRYLERGHGLHGVTFELTEVKFILLQQKCSKMAMDQEEAINDAVRDLQLKPLSGKIRNYPFEHESYRIYQYELRRAKEEKRLSRLHEFSLSPSTDAHTCKAQMLTLLAGVITQKQLERITGWHPTIPRFSGRMENILLHSAGPLYQYQKSSGEVVYYRKGKEAKLYWTFPPQEIETLSDRTRDLFKIHHDHRDEVKLVVRKLQALEWFFRNVELPDIYSAHRNKLIKHIIMLYESFATIEPKKSQFAKNDWTSFWRWLASQPRDLDEKLLLDKLAKAKNFINNLYMAVVDGWDLDGISSNADKNDITWDSNELSNQSDDEDLEILATYLTANQQKELCKIIGRSYVDPAVDLESSFDNEILPNNLKSSLEDDELVFVTKLSNEK